MTNPLVFCWIEKVRAREVAGRGQMAGEEELGGGKRAAFLGNKTSLSCWVVWESPAVKTEDIWHLVLGMDTHELYPPNPSSSLPKYHIL